MGSIHLCSKCGAPLSAGSAVSLCDQCLAPAGFVPAPMPDWAGSGPNAPAANPSSLRLGDYELLEEIARGGMGVVLKARQISLNRIVAVKVVLSGHFANAEAKRRFQAEAEAAARLHHPSIVPVYEAGEHDGQPFFSMELVEGRSLADIVRDGPLPPRRAAGYVKAIAEAIQYAHQQGILHRDLKPSNILIDSFDTPRVTDFGLAKRLTSDSQPSTTNHQLTLSGQVLGSPGYASPEQALGRRDAARPAGDVYSLGAILYHLVSGRPPFQAGTIPETLALVQNAEPVAPHLLNPSVPRDLETICLKCLEKEPGKRYATAQALVDEIGRWLNGDAILARPAGRAEKLWRWCRRKPALAAMASALLLVGAAGLTGILWQWSRAERHATRETAQRVRAEEAVTMLELQRAEDLLEKDEIVMGVASLARIVHRQPTNHLAAQRLLSALIQRDFALPIGPPLLHRKKVQYAEFSPDGGRVATASLDFTARIWDARTGEPLTPPMLHREAVRIAHFSSDGLRLLTFGDDRDARLWDVTTGQALGQPMSHRNRIRTAEFSSDGRRVVTASDDGTARVWDGFTGQALLNSLKHSAVVYSARFSHDGQKIVTACGDGTAQVWDALTGKAAAKPLRHRDAVLRAEFSPDSKWVLTTAGDETSRVWDAVSGEPLANPLAQSVALETAGFSPDGERVLTAPRNGTARWWSTRDWTPLASARQQRAYITAAEFSPEGERVLTGSSDNTARLWDATSGEPLTAPLQHDGIVWSARFRADGFAVVTASADQTARIWDVRSGAARSQLMLHGAEVMAAEFSPDGEWVVTGAGDHTARVWEARTGRLGLTLDHPDWVLAAQFSPDNKRVATGSGSTDRAARIWDARSGRLLVPPLRHGQEVRNLQFSPDGRWLATGSADGAVRLWDARTGEPQGSPIQLRSQVKFLCFSPDGQKLLTADTKDDLVQLREVPSGRLLVETLPREGTAAHGEFSPDGERFVTGSEDGTARIWSVRTGQPLIEPMRHNGSIHWVCFSPDGNLIGTASVDSTAQVWNAETGQPVGEPMRHHGAVFAVAFSPNGQLILTASDDGTARLWDARTGRPVAEPYTHKGKVRSVHFSPDGRRFVAAADSEEVRVWDVPPVPPIFTAHGTSEAAAAGLLLADLAELVIGKRVDGLGALKPIQFSGFSDIQRRLRALPGDSDFTRWMEWFLADRSARSISPYSQIDMPHYISQRSQETNLTSWREALMLCPTNGLALAWIAEHAWRQSKSVDSPEAAKADWASRQAVKFAPGDARAWHYRIQAAERTAGWEQLLLETDEAVQLTSHITWALYAKARALEGLERFDAMRATCDQALNSWEADIAAHWDLPLKHEIFFRRSIAHRHLGRLAEAAADNAAFLGLAARDPQASPNLIDLDAFYNSGQAEEFPGRIERLAGVDFDFRGWIQLDLRLVQPEVTHLPERVDRIPVERTCQRLHFLHAASWASHVSPNTSGVREEVFDAALGVAVGRYVIHYTDGQQLDVPIIHGRDVRDYWHFPESTPDDPALVVAWTGANASSRRHGATTRLYKSTWENPRTTVPIRSLDFVHAKTHAVPILVAITAEP